MTHPLAEEGGGGEDGERQKDREKDCVVTNCGRKTGSWCACECECVACVARVCVYEVFKG